MPQILGPDDWTWRLGRLIEGDVEAEIARALFSGKSAPAPHSRVRRAINAPCPKPQPPRTPACTRYGLVDGGRVRTFHLRIEVAERGGRLARYAHRLDGVREEELESTGGMPVPAFEAAATEREQLHQRRGEWKAPAYHMILELPLEFPPPARHRVMDAVGAHFTEAGHAVTWAVHGTNEHGAVQPHGHVILLAADAADGTACRPVEGGGAMRMLRGFVAGTVNAVAAEEAIPLPAAWHPGSFQDIGNPRPPRTRQAVAVYKARDDRERGRALSRRRTKLAEAADRIRAWDEGRLAAPAEAHATPGEPATATPAAETVAPVTSGGRRGGVAPARVMTPESGHGRGPAETGPGRADAPGRDVTEAVSGTLRRLATERPAVAGSGGAGARPEASVSEPESAGSDHADGRGEAGADGTAARAENAEAAAAELRDRQHRIEALERVLAERRYTQAELDARIFQAVGTALRERVVDPAPSAPDRTPPYATAPIERTVTVPGGVLTRERTVAIAVTDVYNAGVDAGWEARAQDITATWDSMRQLQDHLALVNGALDQLYKERPVTRAGHDTAVEQARREGKREGLRQDRKKGQEDAARGAVGAAGRHRQTVTALEDRVAALTTERDQARNELKALRNAPADRPGQAGPPAGHGSGAAQDRARPAPGRDHGATQAGSGVAPDTAAAGPGGIPSATNGGGGHGAHGHPAPVPPRDDDQDRRMPPPSGSAVAVPPDAGAPRATLSNAPTSRSQAPPPQAPAVKAPASTADQPANAPPVTPASDLRPLLLHPQASHDKVQLVVGIVRAMDNAGLVRQATIQIGAEHILRRKPLDATALRSIQLLQGALGVLRGEMARRNIADPTVALEQKLRAPAPAKDDRSLERD